MLNQPIEMSGAQKAAVMLTGLGPELAASVYTHLSDADIEQVTLELARTEQVQRDTLEEVFAEFRELAVAQAYVKEGGLNYARAILEQAIGSRRAAELLDRVSDSIAPRPFQMLNRVDPMQLLAFLQDEHAQTIALVLSFIRAEVGANVLKALPQELQADVACRIATMDRTNPEVIADVEKLLAEKLSVLFGDFSQPGGVDVAVAILNRVDRTSERLIIGGLETTDPELAEEIRKRMLLFEDIVALDDRFVQRILREVDQDDLVLALKGTSETIAERLYQNMSARQAEVVRDDLQYLGAARLRDVEAAQQRIVAIARRLEDAEEIFISRGDEERMIQ